MTKFVPALSDRFVAMYSAGPWYVRVNMLTGACDVTSGDVWFPCTLADAMGTLHYYADKSKCQEKAAA